MMPGDERAAGVGMTLSQRGVIEQCDHRPGKGRVIVLGEDGFRCVRMEARSDRGRRHHRDSPGERLEHLVLNTAGETKSLCDASGTKPDCLLS